VIFGVGGVNRALVLSERKIILRKDEHYYFRRYKHTYHPKNAEA
jgi:hypothetical protein